MAEPFRRTSSPFLLRFVLLAVVGILLSASSWVRGSEARSMVLAAGGTEQAGRNEGVVLFIENVGQFNEEARYKVQGTDHAIWVTEDAIWYSLLDPSPAGDTPDSPTHMRDAEVVGQGVNIRITFPGSNPNMELQSYQPLSTSVSYLLGSGPSEWHVGVPAWGGLRYRELYPGIDLEMESVEGGVEAQLKCRLPNCAAALAAVEMRVDGAEQLAIQDNQLVVSTAIGQIALPLFAVVDAAGLPLAGALPKPALNKRIISAPLLYGATATRDAAGAPEDDPADLLYSTFLGGSQRDEGNKIAVDAAGNAYITGDTVSTDFPTTPGAFNTGFNGGFTDLFVAKLDSTGSTLIYSTFLGGLDTDYGNSIAVNASGNAFISGRTLSADFPTTPGAYDTTYNGNGDGFVVKLNTSGSDLVYGTFLGGSEDDRSYGIFVEGTGKVHVAGGTLSPDFPTTPGAYDTVYNGLEDVFVAELDAAGTNLLYGTFIGGSDNEVGFMGLAVDAAGNRYIAGETWSTDYPTTPTALDTSLGGQRDAFVSKLNAVGTELVYSTYLGGTADDWAEDLGVDSAGNVYVTGNTQSSDFPTTTSAYDTQLNGAADAFVSKINLAGTALVYSTFLGSSGYDEGLGISVDATGIAYVTGSASSSGFPTTPNAFDTSGNGGTDAFLTRMNSTGTDLLYSTYLGGTGPDNGLDVAQDGAGLVYITGRTGASDFPTTPGAFDSDYSGGDFDGFVSKLNTLTPAAADFIAAPNVGVAPLTVVFTNLSTGDYTTCAWSFGDGGTSNACSNTTHEYLSPGSYTVALTVSGPGGTDTETKTGYVTVFSDYRTYLPIMLKQP